MRIISHQFTFKSEQKLKEIQANLKIVNAEENKYDFLAIKKHYGELFKQKFN